MLCILPVPGSSDGKLELGIEENGIESCEALLLARHFMHQRVYQHPTVKAYTFHLARFMKRYYDAADYLSSLPKYLSQTDNEVLSGVRSAASTDADAAALMKLGSRFVTLEIGEGILSDRLETLKRELAIPSDGMFWTRFGVAKLEKKNTFSFPVLRKSGAVVDASQYATIQIPKEHSNWIYVAPTYEESLRQKLGIGC